jgi:WD40 repeat protein
LTVAVLLHLIQGHALHLSEGLARKLAVEAVLDGHDGCVNRLAWNEDGSMLATASDDCQVGLQVQQHKVPQACQHLLQGACRMCAFGLASLQDSSVSAEDA